MTRYASSLVWHRITLVDVAAGRQYKEAE